MPEELERRGEGGREGVGDQVSLVTLLPLSLIFSLFFLVLPRGPARPA